MAGSVLQYSDIRGLARVFYLDIDSTDQALSDTYLGYLINYWYHWYFAVYSSQQLVDSVTLSFSSGNTAKTWTPGDNPLLSLVRVTATAGSEGTNVLKRVDVDEIKAYQLQHVAGSATATKESGLPTMYAIEPIEPATGTAGGITYNLYVYPVPDATTTVTQVYRAAPDDLAADSDLPRCDPFGSRLIARAAAVDASALTGDFQLSDSLLRSLPQEMQEALAVKTDMLRPNASRTAKTNA